MIIFIFQNCKAGTAKCFDIHCSISNLQKKEEATIIVKARLVILTIVNKFVEITV